MDKIKNLRPSGRGEVRLLIATLKLFPHGGGFSNYSTLIPKLEESGIEITLLGPKTESRIPNKIDYCNFPITDKTLPIAIIYFIKKVVSVSKNFDVINCHLPSPSLAIVGDIIRLMVNKKIIINFYSPTQSLSFQELKENFIHYFPRKCIDNLFIASISVFGCDKYVVASRYQGEQLTCAGCPKEKIEIIPNGVDVSKFSKTNSEHIRPTVGYIGHLRYDKGVEFLIKAFPEVLKEFKNAKLIIAWSGHGSVKVDDLIRELKISDSVEMIGVVDVPKLLSVSDVLVLPYRVAFETHMFPSILLEAFSVGIPVVTSDLPPLNEVVDEGVTGLLVRPGDVEGISKCIIRLLWGDALRGEMRRNQRDVVRRKFDSEKIAERYLNLFQNV